MNNKVSGVRGVKKGNVIPYLRTVLWMLALSVPLIDLVCYNLDIKINTLLSLYAFYVFFVEFAIDLIEAYLEHRGCALRVSIILPFSVCIILLVITCILINGITSADCCESNYIVLSGNCLPLYILLVISVSVAKFLSLWMYKPSDRFIIPAHVFVEKPFNPQSVEEVQSR